MASLLHHGTKEYEDTLVLRNEVLRKPLGLSYDPRELAEEDDSFHIATRLEGKVPVLCSLWMNDGSRCAIGRVNHPKERIRELVNYAESFARKGYSRLFCRPRDGSGLL